MSQPFFSDITMHQCNMTTFCISSFLFRLHLVLLVRFISPPRQLIIQILKLAFAIWFSFICIFYGSIHIWLYTCTTDHSGDTEKNPGPKPRSCQNVSICHWNLTRLTAHSYVSIPNLSIHKFDVTFLLKIYINIPVFLYMMSIWKYRVTNWTDQTTHHNTKGVVYVSISEIPFHWKY